MSVWLRLVRDCLNVRRPLCLILSPLATRAGWAAAWLAKVRVEANTNTQNFQIIEKKLDEMSKKDKYFLLVAFDSQ